VTFRLAVVTAGATFVLILIGGIVTNTGAALAVPDWPSTFGHNMFLFPWSRMVGGVLYEHSHRLIGATVGLLTLGLAGALWRRGGWLRALGLVAVVAVLGQGILGGLRVVLLRSELAIVHGGLAQAFFALLVAIALLVSPVASPVRPVEPSMRVLTVLAGAVVYLQIVFGAFLTHAGRLSLHLVGALAVFTVVPIVTARVRRTDDSVAVATAGLLAALVGVQLVLGTGSYVARFSSMWIPGEPLMRLLLPVTHRVVGSLMLAASVILVLRTLTAVASRRGLARGGATLPDGLSVGKRFQGS